MANFQFTVRATDSDGAYADRNFSITINNTRVERYMVIDNLNAYTSPDLVNWTTRNGQGGWDVAYGNSMWLIVTSDAAISGASQVGGPMLGGHANWGRQSFVIRKSTDGVNFTTVLSSGMTFTKPDGTAFSIPSVASNYMVNGRLSFSNGFFWLPMSWGTVYGASNTSYTQYIAKSADGINWTILNSPAKGSFYFDGGTFGHSLRTHHRVVDSGSDLFINNWGSYNGVVANIYGWRSTDLGTTWTPVTDSTGKSNNNTNYFSSHVTRINGLYLAGVTHTSGVPFMVSNDGFNWSPCNTVSGWSASYVPSNVVYANGTLYAICVNSGTTSSTRPGYLSSTDGINWTYFDYSNTSMMGSNTGYNTGASILYKNGFLMVGGNSVANTTQKPFAYQFAGSTDPVVLLNQSGSGTPAAPFYYCNGVAAMGS